MTQIYKIIDNTNGNIYVGSTNQKICHRMSNHKNPNHNKCISKEIIKNNDYQVIVIEECDEKIRNEREQYWIDNLDCINIQNTFHNSKKYKREYYEKHIDEKREYDKIRREWKMSWGETKRDNCNLTYTNPFIFL